MHQMVTDAVKIIRHEMIRSEANPRDPRYLKERMAWKMGHTLAGRRRTEYLCEGFRWYVPAALAANVG